MTDDPFLRAYQLLLGHEGRYADDPDDAGGETWKGIARNFHPSWSGWRRVDAVKAAHARATWDAVLAADPQLEADVRSFYRLEFWQALGGELFPPELATELFEQGVNLGKGVAVLHLQMVLNAFNDRGRLWPDVAEDAALGPRTRAAAVRAIGHGDTALLVAVLNDLQSVGYLERMRRSPVKEKYARGWWKRTRDVV